ncbi:MAG TPA: YdeI/OmpD-associated family protein [Planctomycetota bacterium]|nr:YdeI/OmpD-associated family protein [Planctomycetota bacterium]
MPGKTVKVKIFRDGSTCYVPVPFDPKAAFGKVRAPVTVTLNGYTYRSTIFNMGGEAFIPLRKSHREAAGLEGGETIPVTIALDEEKREVEVPADLAKALKAAPEARKRWDELSFTCRREHVEAIEGAKKPETRARRIEAAVAMVAARKAKKRA